MSSEAFAETSLQDLEELIAAHNRQQSAQDQQPSDTARSGQNQQAFGTGVLSNLPAADVQQNPIQQGQEISYAEQYQRYDAKGQHDSNFQSSFQSGMGPAAQRVVSRTCDRDYESDVSGFAEKAKYDCENEIEDTESLLAEHCEILMQKIESQRWKTEQNTHTASTQGSTEGNKDSKSASKFPHKVVHPALYRNMHDIGGLDGLAEQIGAPKDWKIKYDAMLTGHYSRMKSALDVLVNLPTDAAESLVSAAFVRLCLIVAMCSGAINHVISDQDQRMIVEGFLADEAFEVRTNIGSFFHAFAGIAIAGTEVKTRSFPLDAVWYHGSPCAQSFAALFWQFAPLFLFNQRQWKLLVESPTRDCILTFPVHLDMPEAQPHVRNSAMEPIGDSLIEAIFICIYAKTHALEADEASAAVTPERSVTSERLWSSGKKADELDGKAAGGVMSSMRTRSKSTSPAVTSFLARYDDDGQPVYVEVRAMSDDDVANIEAELNSQTSVGPATISINCRFETANQSKSSTSCYPSE